MHVQCHYWFLYNSPHRSPKESNPTSQISPSPTLTPEATDSNTERSLTQRHFCHRLDATHDVRKLNEKHVCNYDTDITMGPPSSTHAKVCRYAERQRRRSICNRKTSFRSVDEESWCSSTTASVLTRFGGCVSLRTQSQANKDSPLYVRCMNSHIVSSNLLRLDIALIVPFYLYLLTVYSM